MSKLSLDRFITLVERSKLIDPPTLDSTVSAWKRQATLSELDDATPCAEHLVDTGLLTRWQARKLLEGRHRGFYLGKYKLLDHLGTGGMSSVYLAEHTRLRRRAAIKILPHRRAHDRAYFDRFQIEGQAVAALDHPNIVRAYDLDDDGSLHYLVMEYIEGRDLCHLVEEDGPLDFHTAAEYAAQAAAGLEHAHAGGLVHRDIKPANLLLDVKGTIKILDLGLAKFADDQRDTQADQVVGTADYLAPEQAAGGQSVDHRADIYSLGCTLYFLITGHPPFATGTSVERVAAHQRQSPPSLLVDRPDAPEPLVAICTRMMEKSPTARYQTAGEVRAALTEWLAAEAAEGRSASANRTAVRQVAGARDDGTRRSPQARSHINLISGSAPDLRAAAPANELASPLTDTDANLSRVTLPIAPAGHQAQTTAVSPVSGAASEASQDNAIPPEHPTPPPIPIPPTAAVKVQPLVDVRAPGEFESSAPASIPLGPNMAMRAQRHSTASGRFWWTLASAALLFGAVAWLIVALAR